MKKYFLSVILGMFAISFLQSQIKIGNNPQNIDASSVLELESNSRVLVITRISDAQMNSITPLQGALVYNTDESCVFYYNGTTWINLCEENIFNESFEVVGEELVLIDSNGDSVAVPLSDIGVYTFTNTPVFNPVDNDNTIVITQTGDNVNLEVGEVTGFNIVDSSINGFLDIQDRSTPGDKLQENAIDAFLINPNVAGTGLTQDATGALEVDVSQITGTGSFSSPTSTLTITGDPTNALFNSVGLDVADNAITNAKMANDAIGTAEIINNAVTTDKILDASITNGKLDKPTIPISGFAPGAANVDFGSNRLINVVDPIDIQDAANKNYVDNAVGGLSNLTDGTIYIGDAGNQAQEIAISGDATMDNAGILTIEPDAVDTAEIIDNAVTTDKIGTAGLTDANRILGTDAAGDPQWQDAATIATSLGEDVLSTDGSITGIANNAALVAMDLEVNVDGTTLEVDATNGVQIVDDAITNVKVADNAIQTENIVDGQVQTADIADTNVTNAKLDKANIPLSGFGAAAANVDLGTNRLTNVSDPTAAQDAATRNYVDNAITASGTLTSANILVGNATNVATGVVLSGDATIDNTGALTIANDAITNAKVADNAIGTTEIIDANVTPVKIEPSATNGQVLTTSAGAVTWQNPADATATAMAGSIFFADGANGLAENNAQLFWDATTNRMSIGAAARPLDNKFTVVGQIRSSSFAANPNGSATNPPYRFINDTNSGMFLAAVGELAFTSNSVEAIRIDTNQNVGIGINTIAANTRLHVVGNSLFDGDVTITTGNTFTPPDYVFEKYFNGISNLNPSYKMPSLYEVERFTKKNKHLPGIPSAFDMQKNGLLLNKTIFNHLEKIEELFLHTIEQEKKINQLESKNEDLAKELNTLKKDLVEIKALLKKQ